MLKLLNTSTTSTSASLTTEPNEYSSIRKFIGTFLERINSAKQACAKNLHTTPVIKTREYMDVRSSRPAERRCAWTTATLLLLNRLRIDCIQKCCMPGTVKIKYVKKDGREPRQSSTYSFFYHLQLSSLLLFISQFLTTLENDPDIQLESQDFSHYIKLQIVHLGAH